MAIGKNIKRQQLIPSPSGNDEVTKAPVEKKPKAGVKSERKNQAVMVNEKVSKPTLSQEQTHQDVREVTLKTQASTKYLTEAEYNKRHSLQSRFDTELANLAGEKVHLIVFELGEEEYAFDLAKTREVVSTPPISKMPYTPEYIKGVTEIRGSVIQVFNLAQKFQLSKSEDSKERYTVVMENDQVKVGILVPKVPTTLIVKGEEIKSSSGIVSETALDTTYIKGIIKLDGRMIFWIDIDELIESDKVSMMTEEIA